MNIMAAHTCLHLWQVKKKMGNNNVVKRLVFSIVLFKGLLTLTISLVVPITATCLSMQLRVTFMHEYIKVLIISKYMPINKLLREFAYL